TIVFNGSVGVNAIKAYNLNANSFLTSSWMHDGAGTALTSTLLSGKQALDVNIAGGVTINVALDHTTDNVLVYGNDGTTDRKILTTATGAVQTSITNFPATTAVTQSTSPWVVSGTVSAVQSGTWNINNISGTVSLPTGAATETTLAGIKTDTDKLTFTATRLLVDGSGVTQPVSGTITANAGTGNFTVAQATGTNLHAVIDSGSITVANATLAVTQSGTWNLNNISGTISLPTGAATSAKQPALGSAGTPSADVLTVQGTVGMVALKVDGSGTTQPISGTVTANIGTTNGLALDATVSGLQVAQGSSTSGQHGSLILGAVTTLAPSYTTAQSSPLSLTVAGALRVDASATVQPVSGIVTANAGTGNFTVIQSTGSNLHTVVDSGTVSVNQGSAAALSAAWPVELSDGTNLLGTAAHPVRIDPTGTTTQPVSLASTTITGTVAVTQSGVWTTGRTWTLASGTDSISAVQSGTWNINNISGTVSLPTGAATAANQTTLGSQTTKINDGTNTAAVKAASTAAVATDPALVVALSPNNIIPVNNTQVAGSAIATAATGIAKVGLTDGSGNPITSYITRPTNGRGLNVTTVDGPQIDSYSRQRVTQPEVLFATYFSNSAHSLYYQNVLTGSATVALNTTLGSLRLNTTTASGDSIVLQSRR